MKKKKKTHKVDNWAQYNRALINRGNLNIWISKTSTEHWYSKKISKRGRPFTYSSTCIEVCLALRALFRFPLRAIQGFLESLHLLEGLKIPHYSCYSRRAKHLKINLSHKAKKQGATDIAIDSTGIKVYGEGEWKTKVHGKGKRREWRKLHVAIDPESGQLVKMELTKGHRADDPMMAPLLKGLKDIRYVYADGAYISKRSFNAIVKTGAKAKIPLRTGTTTGPPHGDKGLVERNRLVREIEEKGGRVSWKRESDYHKRSLVETYMYRFKKIFGGELSSRKFENQVIEAQIKGSMMNRMTHLGMPDSSPVG